MSMTDTKRRYPRVGAPSREARDAVRARIDRLHSEVAVTWEEGGQEEIYCGDNWCTGWCGLSALLANGKRPGETYKASGPQVAMGMMMQELRVKWVGNRIEVPEQHREDFLKRWYL